jgi:hypothetical protein
MKERSQMKNAEMKWYYVKVVLFIFTVITCSICKIWRVFYRLDFILNVILVLNRAEILSFIKKNHYSRLVKGSILASYVLLIENYLYQALYYFDVRFVSIQLYV